MTGQAEEFDLRSTALMFWRHRRFLLASIILLGGLATLLGSQRPPMYTAEALVALSPQESRILSSEAVEPSLTPTEQTIGTQISIIGSRQHARRTVEELRLAEVHEFAGQDVEGVPGKLWRLARAQVEDWLGRSWMASATTSEVPPALAAGEQPVGEEAVTSAFLKRLAVRNVPRSHVIGIAFTSRDPELAARAANTVAELYVADQRQAKLEATTGASRWLETRVDQLRAELIEAERAVERFRADNDLVELAGQTLAGENLADLNRQLQAADADLARRKHSSRSCVTGRRRAASSSPERGRELALLQHLREQQAELRRQEAQLVSSLGERHPRIAISPPSART